MRKAVTTAEKSPAYRVCTLLISFSIPYGHHTYENKKGIHVFFVVFYLSLVMTAKGLG